MKKLNVKLLEKIKKHILEEPLRLNMEVFQVSRDDAERGEWCGSCFDPGRELQYPGCGMAACVAGWACLLYSHRPYVGVWGLEAKDILGLNAAEANHLFYRWHRTPAYKKASPKMRAGMAVREINKLIKSRQAQEAWS